MSGRIIRPRQVERDLAEIADYIGQRNPRAGLRFFAAAVGVFGNPGKLTGDLTLQPGFPKTPTPAPSVNFRRSPMEADARYCTPVHTHDIIRVQAVGRFEFQMTTLACGYGLNDRGR